MRHFKSCRGGGGAGRCGVGWPEVMVRKTSQRWKVGSRALSLRWDGIPMELAQLWLYVTLKNVASVQKGKIK